MFESELFRDDPLLAAIANDTDRISTVRNQFDPAVRKVQLALLIWEPGSLPVAGADGEYGSETAGAVRRFKIEVIGVPPDQVIADVGPQTVLRLDAIAAEHEQPPALCAMRITGTETAMRELTGMGGLSLVRATATAESDGRHSVLAYGSAQDVNMLSGNGFEVAVLCDTAVLKQRWDTVSGQIEGAL
ncbi:peptidoglycan-binding protein [Nocardia sp. NPDC127526]|uniref:peptidoglycan-binding domain-containing protein n=1 Tax=Nocardia sp. NPDC127526 TaxID=3345393 RepID=UPI0036390B35